MGAPKSHRIPGGVGQLISCPGLVNPLATETGLTPSLLLGLLLGGEERTPRGQERSPGPPHRERNPWLPKKPGPGSRLDRTGGETGEPGDRQAVAAAGADPDLKDRTGFAVLHDAARAGFLDTLQTLLEFRADVNVEDNEGNLPLHLAAQEGHLAVVAFLLERTASRVEHRNKKGATAYDLAKLYKRQAVAELLDNSRRREGALSGD
ncbi:hypothetical protein E2320_010245 [Naja naja]|nr:hypothetical protein E2320_010245 [Naja naja]